MIDLKHAAYVILHNIMVEAVIVIMIGLVYELTRGLDRVFHTKLKRGLIDRIHRTTMDNLSRLRRTQIRYMFRTTYGLKKIKIRLAGGSYWMSIPCIVEGIDKRTNRPAKFLGKIINDRSALLHRYMTVLRNLGIMAEGASLEFDDYQGAVDMVEFERNALMLLRNRHVSVPEVFGTHRLNHDDYILV
ncbi:MAG TPA: serine/threonine protein kinase, partial [Methanocella sp.]|nr:serine/threonine protein kinase [Methanocella sp.]